MNRKYRITYLIGDSKMHREVNAYNIWDAIHQFRDCFPDVHMTEVIEL